MRSAARLVLAAVALGYATTSAGAQEAAPGRAHETTVADPDAAWRETTRKALEDTLARTTRDGFFGAILVVRDGRTLLRHATGTAGHDGSACTPDTLFDLASVSKQFTAAAVLVLQARGRLSLHDRLDRFFRDAPADKRAIRIEQLLTHVAGLPQNVAADDAQQRDRDRWLRLVFATPLVGAPGERFVYSNAGYGLLAAIVESTSNQRFEAFVRDAVFGPAGMSDTSFIASSPIGDPRLARAARRSTGLADERFADTALAWPWHWGFRGASGVVSTIDELYRWDRALTDDRVLRAHERTLLLEPQQRNYAGGLEASTTPRGTVRQAHSGSVHGFQSWFARYPDENSFATVLGNERYVISALAEGIEQTMFGAGAPPSVTQAVVGRFRAADGQRVELHLVAGRVHAACSGTALSLRARGNAAGAGHDGARGAVLARRMERALGELLARRSRAARAPLR